MQAQHPCMATVGEHWMLPWRFEDLRIAEKAPWSSLEFLEVAIGRAQWRTDLEQGVLAWQLRHCPEEAPQSSKCYKRVWSLLDT